MRSRFMLNENDPELFSHEKNAERYKPGMMFKYGYKSRRAMFKEMHSCDIQSAQGSITISPSWHEKLELWSGTGLKGTADLLKVPVYDVCYFKVPKGKDRSYMY